MDIDWSKAPEGTRYFAPAKGHYTARWFKPNKDAWLVWEADQWMDADPTGGRMAMFIERPAQEWTGEGLPPVGLQCEAFYHNDTQSGWKPFTLLFISGETIVFQGLGEVARERREFELTGPKKFRPIRTPEQIAAEEREKAISSMIGVVNAGYFDNTRAIYGALYDAGYRKFEIVDE